MEKDMEKEEEGRLVRKNEFRKKNMRKNREVN
jgi:hypothetical protein